ncbi:hypothetical protein Sdagh_14370 [Streptomyces daghestanicus]|uniref:Uncharacterized protein n=1 Tax=Streptomyces daghestanicus TaxID=66885 RepID=A0ABQ3PXG7_9ACTN|nr:hypothetical protein Sdagh_14370 [Streptomyces daghestanicus]
MMSPWEHIRYTASGPWSRSTRAFHSRTASAARVCMARIDSPPGEGRGGRVRLDDLHQRLVLQLGELAAGPVAVVALADPLVGVDAQLGPGVEERPDRLLAALQGAGDDLGDRQRGEPGGQGGGLGGTAFVEGDAGRPAGEQPLGVWRWNVRA